MIVTGCSFVVFDIINGCKKFPSKNCIKAITTIDKIPIVGLWVNPTITAGAPPIYGPAYGIKFVSPQKNPNKAGAFKPTNHNPIEVKINTTEQSITAPWTYFLS